MKVAGLAAAYGSTLLLTLANLLTIFAFGAIFVGLGVVPAGSARLATTWLVVGLFVGSSLWWLGLSTLTSHLRSRLRPAALRLVNRVSGGAIAGFGLIALASLLG